MSNPDIELGHTPAREPQRSPPARKGFSAVASKIASDVDKTTTLYRRFDNISARNLLYYQAEIAELEELQNSYDELDRLEKDKISNECQRDWSQFAERAKEGRKREREHMELAIRIRDKIERYHQALVNHQVLLNSPPPSKSTVTAMRNWFFNTGNGSGAQIPQTWGASESIYDDAHDIVALKVPPDQDRLTSFIQNNFGLFFKTSKLENGQAYVSQHNLSRFISFLSTLLAAILLLGAIVSLYTVKDEKALLFMVCGWTVLFASCVGFLMSAKRDAVFAATAAYAAVLVVFVSGDLGRTAVGTYSCNP
ncbi:hypothetical protein HYFRA_00010451 [Hymenoscyphus fraxineus]|uniref:DUF6594 domain-containing protein n=1 Tax=Hymenoscyphus fraxineus TaxID=746836 RepID=A0A9N9L4I5_9HELO|nr:hypothetical protein HYFRA_00010451 [Hymenoscyphus fraxineus]